MLAGSQRFETDREELIGRRIALVSMSVGALLCGFQNFGRTERGLDCGRIGRVGSGGRRIILRHRLRGTLIWRANRPTTNIRMGTAGMKRLQVWPSARCSCWPAPPFSGTAFRFRGANRIARFRALSTLAAVVIKIALAAMKFRVGKRIASASLEADGWHDITDLLSTSVALVAVVLTLSNPMRFGAADHVGGMLIGVIIFFLSIQRSAPHGRSAWWTPCLSRARWARFVRSRSASRRTLGIEKCFARRTGLKYHVDLHLEVDPEMTVRESHEIAAEVRNCNQATPALGGGRACACRTSPAAGSLSSLAADEAGRKTPMENKEIARLL